MDFQRFVHGIEKHLLSGGDLVEYLPSFETWPQKYPLSEADGVTLESIQFEYRVRVSISWPSIVASVSGGSKLSHFQRTTPALACK